MLPEKLKQGDTIGIFSPSSPFTYLTPKRFERGKKFLESKGFKVLDGKLTGKYDYYRSGSIKERTEELNELIRNKEVKCIMATIGGLNSNSLLPYIDYEALRNNPKIIIGYSDVTAILLGIYAKIGLTTFYGPALIASFGELSPFVDLTYEYFKNILVDEKELPYEMPTPSYWTEEYIDWERQNRSKKKIENKLLTLNPGVAEGRLIGGNLNTMLGIWGSPYMPEIEKGDILLIEDSLKDIGTVERSFAHLKINGVFDKIGGIILGKHELFDNKESDRKHYEVLKEVIGHTNIPILAEFDCSHTHPMLTMPIGVKVRLDADRQKVELLEKYID
ncbi:S66 family peptidase [Miniphocaeibacter halophilus]|uniref:LD-carboxypeptidase n=1 Tax=Miniphocaeibacter halophilus TaxID=2931922 RepID=A0AC61MTT5_9FIRM|nr:S66 peptidase family protein [Miniphocaeibacter halophilus]QQK08803.1 LD-carboxypeptidase [Miniphocaeibacter halophilus]